MEEEEILGGRVLRTFALIGAAGYIAPRHMRAISAVNGDLKVIVDPRDSVGVIDSYFPDAAFFTELERFDRHLAKLRKRGTNIDYISICSPNYLHDAHCRLALRAGAHAICEKPLVLNPQSIEELAEIEGKTGRRIFTIQQLRLHPAIQALKSKVDASTKNSFDVDVTYITTRGQWYHASWKGDEQKSGGVAVNIGFHLFDILVHVFGRPTMVVTHLRDRVRAAGFLLCERASVRWFLSVDRNDLPLNNGSTSHRSINIDGEEIEFSDGFADLHTRSYEEIVAGNGFGLDVAQPSIEVVAAFRSAALRARDGERHPMVDRYVLS
jgi:UDP-N-acetyl-2-amino-2-deoxyglucuronate dehydrogenase